MRVVHDTSWERRGMTLLWGAETLDGLTQPEHVVSIREFFAFTGNWPEALPSNSGDTLVVAGLEGCLDTLTPEDAADWLGGDLKTQILRFQDEYEGQAGLVLWLPSGRQRIHMEPASEAYFWRCAPPFSQRTLPLGQLLWAGAEADVGHLLNPSHTNQDADGPAWIGLHHPRIS